MAETGRGARRWRKKPVVVEAILWDGTNWDEIRDFAGDMAQVPRPQVEDYGRVGDKRSIPIETLEGVLTARQGDWIIRGIEGEFYPCKPDIFEATYEPEQP